MLCTYVYSIINQLLDIRSDDQSSNEQNGTYSSKQGCFCKIFHREKYLPLEKSYTTNTIAYSKPRRGLFCWFLSPIIWESRVRICMCIAILCLKVE